VDYNRVAKRRPGYDALPILSRSTKTCRSTNPITATVNLKIKDLAVMAGLKSTVDKWSGTGQFEPGWPHVCPGGVAAGRGASDNAGVSVDSVNLSPGEAIVWSGAPSRHPLLRPCDRRLIPFSFMWGGISIWIALSTIAGGVRLNKWHLHPADLRVRRDRHLHDRRPVRDEVDRVAPDAVRGHRLPGHRDRRALRALRGLGLSLSVAAAGGEREP
jgi:hypothetical protein